MVLVDTSIWIDHLHIAEPQLLGLLDGDLVLRHPLILGELAVGSIKSREKILNFLGLLPGAIPASHDEVMGMIERHRLYGRGVGFVDCHLLASARIGNALLWSRDRRLMAVAAEMQVAFPETSH